MLGFPVCLLTLRPTELQLRVCKTTATLVMKETMRVV